MYVSWSEMYLHERGIYWHLLEHPEFFQLGNIADNTMKERHSMGLGVRKSAEVIPMQNEVKMFDDGILWEDTPEKLLKTMVYVIDMHCALICGEGGAEHNNLRRLGCDSQFRNEVDNSGKECLVRILFERQIREG